MPSPDGFWFVCRSRREGPLSKRIRRIQAPSILAWFQWQLDDARTSAAPRKVAESQLGGPVRDLADLFEATQRKVLHTPRSTPALRKMLREHLRNAQDAETIQVDDHCVRVLCKDDDLAVAYFFFDDAALHEAPSQWAWLLHETEQLPGGESSETFRPPPGVPALAPPGPAANQAVYACFFTAHQEPSRSGMAVRFDGIGLPDLAPHLVRSVPAPDSEGTPWPIEIRALRALVEEGDCSLTPALLRMAAFPLRGIRDGTLPAWALGPHAQAKGQLLAAGPATGSEHGSPEPKVSDGPHAVLLCAAVSSDLGYEQWILFDDRWAAAHQDLATSILRTAMSWDPCTKLKAPRPPKPELPPRAPKEPSPKPPRPAWSKPHTPRPARPPSKQQAAWIAGLAGRTESNAVPYRPTLRYAEGELILHAKFGLGFVSRAEQTKCEIVFADGPRLLVHAVGL